MYANILEHSKKRKIAYLKEMFSDQEFFTVAELYVTHTIEIENVFEKYFN